MKVYFIVGEASGDLHAKNLILALKEKNPSLQFQGVGGDLMESAGVNLTLHIRETNFMGFWEVIRNIRTIRRLFSIVKQDIKDWQPDAVILVDYPGFNLRMAPFIKGLGIRVFYYISPQVWAWKKGRVKKLKKYTDRVFSILPFEKDFFAKEGLEVDFVGHPLLDEVEGNLETQPRKQIALLPGSRKQEISSMLPVMLRLVEHFPEYEFVVAGAPTQEENYYHEFIGNTPVKLVMNDTYQVLSTSAYAIVTSGTATLETALLGIPQIVCYKSSWLTYQIGKRVVNVSYISLVNLILNRKLVEELIQQDFNLTKLIDELNRLMGPEAQEIVKQGYKELRTILGKKGASERTATHILNRIDA